MTGQLPVVSYRDAEPESVSGTIAGILLAAGRSARFGPGNKLCQPLVGEPLVCHAARTLIEADLSPLVAVVGWEAPAVEDAIGPLAFDIVENPAYETGQSTSVAAGIAVLPDNVDAAVFALGDMPLIEPKTIHALVAAYEAGEGSALAAAYEGTRGNPVLFDAKHFQALSGVSGDVGGREIFLRGEEAALIETGDPGVLIDVDTPDDLASIRDERL